MTKTEALTMSMAGRTEACKGLKEEGRKLKVDAIAACSRHAGATAAAE